MQFDFIRQSFHAAGLSDQEIIDFTGFTPAELQKLFSRP